MSRVTILITMFVTLTPVAVAKATPEFSVPFIWSKKGHVMVNAVINDNWEILMAVDTGAQFGLVPEIAIKVLGIKPEDIEFQHAMTATDSRTLRSTRLDSITVGGYKIRDQNVLILDLDHVTETSAQPKGVLPTGVLPMTFINQFNVHFNLVQQQLEFYDRKTDVEEYLDLNSYVDVDYQSVYGFIKFPIQINDQVIAAILDTGASGISTINWQAAKLLGVERDDLKLKEGREIQGAGKHPLQTKRYVFEQFRIGGIERSTTTMDIFDMPHFDQLLDDGPAANIGLSAFGASSLLVDYENQRLYLEK